MATAKPNPAKDKLKSRMKKEVKGIEEKASIFNGEKEKIGKFKTNKTDSKDKKKKEDEEGDMDKFLRQVEEGFLDIKAVKAQDKKPYDGLLGNVQVERLVKTTNK